MSRHTFTGLALAAIAVILAAQTLVMGLHYASSPTVTVEQPNPEPAAMKAIAQQTISDAGLTGEALDKKMAQAIISFIKSRAKAKPQAAKHRDNAPAPSADRDIQPLDPTNEPIAGTPGARYQMIVYSDYECPFCKRFDPTLKQVIARYGDRLAIGQRDFPLSFHGQAALDEAAATACVFKLAGNDAFWPYSHAIFAATGSNGAGVAGGMLEKLAVKAGVDADAFKHCMASGATQVKIKRDQASGAAAGVRGTPTTFIYDTQTGRSVAIRGAQPLSAVTSALDNLLGAKAPAGG